MLLVSFFFGLLVTLRDRWAIPLNKYCVRVYRSIFFILFSAIFSRDADMRSAYYLRQRVWVAGWVAVCHTGIVSKRLNLS